ncbi:putative methyltransferase-domain-containing protein [Vararia minispora EC-137]|uniref:Methyltransferase-domain-containing protein n=1 Tax=Vararia minispora EC-137 TaxID=1314806 RepID=A0ACB8QAN5_9AGAM|nr:putative methyltransferase-domain-containing protein [Vararia minispora EC-137]
MFYYLSFLRPPPHASPHAPITLTPQVSNDLRTESFPGAADIFFHWRDIASDALLTPPAKLTTWRATTAYKPLAVPPPPRAVPCVLVLAPTPAPSADAVDLRSSDCGRLPLPVRSLPITFGSTKQQNRKQEAIERVFVLSSKQPLLRIRERTSFDLDKKLWDSGLGLAAWLVQQFAGRDPAAGVLQATLWDTLYCARRCRAIELGAGTGMVSLVLAALRSVRSDADVDTGGLELQTEILSTDLPSSLELMEHNIAANRALFARSPPVARALNWEEEIPVDVRDGGGFDVVMRVCMADVTYNTASFPALVSTLSVLLMLDPTAPPLVLLAYKERDSAERDLWDILRIEAGLALEKVGSCAGAGGQEVEIWLGRRPAE